MNRQWHAANAMPANATMDDRIAWHLEHAVHCGCRDIPKGIQNELERRGISVKAQSPHSFVQNGRRQAEPAERTEIHARAKS